MFSHVLFVLALVVDLEVELSILTSECFRWDELRLLDEPGIFVMEAQEPRWIRHGVPEVGLHLDTPRLSDETFIRTVAHNGWCFPEVGLIGNDFDSASFCDGDD